MKLKKVFIFIFSTLCIGCILFSVYKVLASEKLEVIKYIKRYSEYGIIYNNNVGYFSYDGHETTIENVVDAEMFYGDIFHINTDGNLYLTQLFFDDANESKLVFSNIKEIRYGTSDTMFALSNDNKLYLIARYNNAIQIQSSLTKVNDENVWDYKYIVSSDVKDYRFIDQQLLYRDFNDSLYAIGYNRYGNKINEGNYLSSPTKILDNVIKYDRSYAIDSNNDLYLFNINLAIPTVLSTNVVDVITSDNNSVNFNYFYIKKTDGSYYAIKYTAYNNELTKNDETMFKMSNTCNDINKDYDNYLYLDNNVLYAFFGDNWQYSYNKEYYVCPIISNVKDYQFGYILTNDNKLYGTSSASLTYTLTHLSQFNNNFTAYKLIDNVKDISYIGNGIIIMNDDTLWGFGRNENNFLRDKSLSDSSIPVALKDLPNVPDTIKVKELDLITMDKTEFTVGDTVDYYANVFPYNAINKDVVWKSSNEEVATVNELGLVTTKAVGTTKISVSLADGTLKKEVEINVYPAPSKIEITNGESLDLEIYERVILTANVSPSNTLKKKVTWTADSNNVEFTQYSYDKKTESYHLENLDDNQIIVYVDKGGTYTVTATTEDGKQSDTITLKTIEKVSNIRVDIDKEHFDGVYSAFMYLNESNKLKVNYEIYPETASNKDVVWESSDTSIATVSQDGIITAKKTGRCMITISSVDGNATTSFNLLVYNYNTDNVIVGDVNGDGEVNILDLIKLRRYLAGLEDSLE